MEFLWEKQMEPESLGEKMVECVRQIFQCLKDLISLIKDD